MFLVNEKKSPFFIEYYAGDWIRSHTDFMYKKIINEAKVYSHVDSNRFWGRHIWNILDIVTFEPMYRNAQENLHKIHHEIEFISRKTKRMLTKLGQDPLLLEYFSNKNHAYRSFFEYELINKLKNISVLESFSLYNEKHHILYASEENEQITFKNKKSLKKIIFKNKMFYLPIFDVSNKKLGYLVGRLNLAQSFDLPVLGKMYSHYMGMITDHKMNVINKHILDVPLEKNILEKNGKLAGKYNQYRLVAKITNGFIILIFYPFTGYFYYLFILTGYFLIFLFCKLLYKRREHLKLLIKTQMIRLFKNKNSNLEEALSLNAKLVNSVNKSYDLLSVSLKNLSWHANKKIEIDFKNNHEKVPVVSSKNREWIEDSFFIRDLEAKEIHGSKKDITSIMEAREKNESSEAPNEHVAQRGENVHNSLKQGKVKKKEIIIEADRRVDRK